nr:hypothetical protein [Paenibacillus cineris]
MGNAIIELKNCAARITDSNDNDGVAVPIERRRMATPTYTLCG